MPERRRLTAFVAAGILILAGCHPAQPVPVAISASFSASSAATRFGVVGQFSGTIHQLDSTFHLRIDSAAVRAGPALANASFALTAAIAEVNQAGRWEFSSRSTPRSIIPRTSGEWATIPTPIDFVIPIPADIDPTKNWVAFEFTIRDPAKSYTTSAYVHSATTLSGDPTPAEANLP